MGGWNAMALARDKAAMAAIHEEFNSRLLRAELPDPKEFQAIVAPFETKFEGFARLMPTGGAQGSREPGVEACRAAGGARPAVRPDSRP